MLSCKGTFIQTLREPAGSPLKPLEIRWKLVSFRISGKKTPTASSSRTHVKKATFHGQGTEGRSVKDEADVDVVSVISSSAEAKKPEIESESDRVTSSDSDSSSGPSSSEERPRAAPIPQPPEGFRFLQRKKVGALRVQKLEHHKFTVCGRLVSANLGEPTPNLRPAGLNFPCGW